MRALKSIVYSGIMAMLLQFSGACLPLKSIGGPALTPFVTTSPMIPSTYTFPPVPSALPASPTPTAVPNPCSADFIPLGFWPDSNHLLGQLSASNQSHERLDVLDLTTGQVQTVLELPELSYSQAWMYSTIWASLTADHSIVGIPQPSGDSIQIFDLDRKQEPFSLTGHTDLATVLAFSPHDGKLYTSKGASVDVWDRNGTLLSTFKPTFTFSTGNGYAQIAALAISPDGAQLVALPLVEGWVTVHSTTDFHKLADYHGSICGAMSAAQAAFSPDGHYLAVDLNAGPDDISLWRVVDGELLWQGGDTSFAFSPDGRLFARAEQVPGDIHYGQIVISSADGQRNVHIFGSPHEDWINRMFFSPDSQQLVIHMHAKTEIWRVEDAQLVFTYQPTCK